MRLFHSITPQATVSYRQRTPEDQEFLFQVYASTRQAEMNIVPWPEEQKALFLHQQFQAQTTFYDQQFICCQFAIIVNPEHQDIGRLYLERREEEYRIIDIALLPEFQNQGTGGAILRDILNEAQQQNPPLKVRIHVDTHSPAVSLYTRLGFQKIDSTGVDDLMEWTPETKTTVAP